jgi:hypothetical protein
MQSQLQNQRKIQNKLMLIINNNKKMEIKAQDKMMIMKLFYFSVNNVSDKMKLIRNS